jgi:hypothetical protein
MGKRSAPPIPGSIAIAISMAVASVTLAPGARAEDEPPDPPIPPHRITYDSLFGFRLNPLGIEEQYALSYKARFYASDSKALRENYFALNLAPTLSPAISRFGGNVEVRPLTILSLSAGFYQVAYLGSFGTLASYPSAASDYSDTAIDAGKDAGTNHPAKGFEVVGRATALAKAGPIVFRSDTLVYYTDLGLSEGDTVYYYPRLDVIAPDGGVMIASDLDVAWLTDFRLLAGARASVVDSFTDAADPDPLVRVGPLLAYTFFDEPGARFNKPMLIGILQWWLLHPYRTGEDVHQAIPYGTIAFRFEGELWRSE